ncbi:hypothetical protein [Metapseudomonas otitidis]|uniref:hypothetical protein n=1 Tax=Metapseudomonas otitidis TaxID=319939 RepID=UPI001603A2F8|nr:hypothetical protein [Pseudomonas otitidis]
MEQIISFFKENSSWLFGGGGAAATIIAVWKLLLQKPTVQQTQIINGDGEGYQAGGRIDVHKEDGAPKC